MITMITPTYLVEITRMKPPTISIDATITTQHAADTQQEPLKIHMPQQHVAEATPRGSANEEEAVRGEETSNLEENWGPQEYNEGGGDATEGIQERGDTAGGVQGELLDTDTYSQGMRAEPTEQ